MTLTAGHPMTDIDITAARAICEGVQFEETIELEWEGAPYMQTQRPTDAGRAFYEAAHKGWPAALDEIARLRGEVERLRVLVEEACGIAESHANHVVDTEAGYTDFVTEAIADLQRVARIRAARGTP